MSLLSLRLRLKLKKMNKFVSGAAYRITDRFTHTNHKYTTSYASWYNSDIPHDMLQRSCGMSQTLSDMSQMSHDMVLEKIKNK